MNKKHLFCLFILAVFLPFSMVAQQKMKLAVLDPVIAGEKLTDGLAISVREIVSSCFVNNADNYSIVERSLIDKVMQEAKFSNSDAVDESQATQLGKLAGADKVVLTVISRFDNRCMMSVKLIDVESATIDRQISKLVDITSVLDVTEPLTLAVLGKGDANLIVSQPANNQQPNNQTTAENNDNSKSGSGIKGIFKNKNSKNKSEENKTVASQISVPEFGGAGINYMPLDIKIYPQPEEFVLDNFAKIYYNNNFNIIVDFSETRVAGIPLLKFREMKQPKDDKVFGTDFFNRMSSEISRFMKALNDESNSTFSFWTDAPVTLYVKVWDIDEPGRVNLSDFAFIDNESGEILSGIRIKSKGGRFGSWTNLLGDAFEEDAAPDFGKKFKSAKKKYKKIISK